MNRYRINFDFDFFLTIEAWGTDAAWLAAEKLARIFESSVVDVEEVRG